MAVATCYLCNEDPIVKRRYGDGGLPDGEVCPICYGPTCRYHLTTVRWKWRTSGQVEAILVCKDCKRSYKHRNWATHERDWIT